jgi:nitroreductase
MGSPGTAGAAAARRPDAADLHRLVSAAVAAPSIHNTQPWRYRFDPDTVTVEVRAAADRVLPRTDPDGRALHISVGAAVFNLRIACEQQGRQPLVRLLPRADEPDLVATLDLAPAPGRTPREDLDDLYGAIWRRHSSRRPYAARPVPEQVRAELARAAAEEGALLHFPGRTETTRILQLTAMAEQDNNADPGRRGESHAWVRDGIPAEALGPRDANGTVPLRDFTAASPADRRPREAFEAHPLVAVLATAGDRPADWVRAGQALEHVLLAATARGLRASLLHQALEWPDLRWALRDVREGVEHPQMLLRLGYGPEGSATPRRPVAEVLDEE